MSCYKTCPRCGSHLDPGEICDCIPSQDNNQRFHQLLNSYARPRAVYNALLGLGRAGIFNKGNTPASAANADEGKVEQSLTDTDSTSNDT